MALVFVAMLDHFERRTAEVERLATELIELATRQHFAFWLAIGTTFRGWARSVSGEAVEGLRWIEDGIRAIRATGGMRALPHWLAVKAEALHLAARTPEALETIQQAEALAESSDEGWWRAELQRLRGVFLASLGADETAERIWPKRSRWLRSRIREPPTLGSPSGSLACDRPKRVDSS